MTFGTDGGTALPAAGQQADAPEHLLDVAGAMAQREGDVRGSLDAVGLPCPELT